MYNISLMEYIKIIFVFKIPWKVCNVSYIGETKRSFKVNQATMARNDYYCETYQDIEIF